MPRLILPLLIPALVLALISGPARAEFPDCPSERVLILSPDGAERARYLVAVADTAETRERGLMFVETLPEGEGMLFIFEEAAEVAFWMRNTLIPLDMIFIEATGRVVTIHEGAIPQDETPIFSDADVISVLEVNAGEVERAGIRPGDLALSPHLPMMCDPGPGDQTR